MQKKSAKASDKQSSNKNTLEYPSESRIGLYRNLSYGGAGSCLIMILALLQVWTDSTSLTVALYAACAAIPGFFALGGIYEAYIFAGKKSYGHFKGNFSQELTTIMFFLSGLSLLTSLVSIIFYLSEVAAFVFGGSLVISLVVAFIFNHHLERSLKK